MKNMLFVGGPMNGKFSPMPNDSGHVVAKSDNITDPRTGKPMQWTYYRKHLPTRMVKRRDGRKVPRHVEVFVHEGHKMDVDAVRHSLLRAIPKKMPDLIWLSYSDRMRGITVYKRANTAVKQFVILDKELRESLVKTEALKNLVRLGRSPKPGYVEVDVNEESLAALTSLYEACHK